MTSPDFQLRLLGRFEIVGPADAPPVRLATRKASGLLAYLAMAPDCAAAREEVATLLWGNVPDTQARQTLRQTLLLLRKDLPNAEILTPKSGVVQLKAGQWRVDARDFELLSRSASPADLNAAARLFAGDFLNGLTIEEEGFVEWRAQVRQRLQLAAAGLAESFVLHPELVLDGEAAITMAERLIAQDPLREDWQRFAILLCARYRGKAEALARADSLTALLRRDVQVAPDAETQEIVRKIRTGEIAAVAKPISRPVAPASEPAAVTTPAAPPLAGPQHHRGSRAPLRTLMIGAIAGVAVLLLAGAAGLAYWTTREAPPSARPAPVADNYWRSPAPLDGPGATTEVIPLLLLPFRAASDTHASVTETTQVAADRLTDDLSNLLSHNRTFRVISQSTARRVERPVNVAAIGAELRVRFILEGTVRLQDDKMRVNVELVDTRTQAVAWSGRVERDHTDGAGVHDEIVGRLARELHFEILPIESERLRGDPTAEGLVHRGWSAMWAAFARSTPEAFKQAETLFLEALAREPQSLSASIGLGALHANLGAQGLTPDTKMHLEKALRILNEALLRAPTSGNIHFYLGLVHGASNRLDDAFASFKRAIETTPSNASAHAHFGHTMARTGRAAEGIEHLRYAIRLSPRDPNLAYWYEFIGSAELTLNRDAEAIENFKIAQARNPGYPRAAAGLAAGYALIGNMIEARKYADEIRKRAPNADLDTMLARFARPQSHAPRLYEGLRIALTVK